MGDLECEDDIASQGDSVPGDVEHGLKDDPHEATVIPAQELQTITRQVVSSAVDLAASAPADDADDADGGGDSDSQGIVDGEGEDIFQPPLAIVTVGRSSLDKSRLSSEVAPLNEEDWASEQLL